MSDEKTNTLGNEDKELVTRAGDAASRIRSELGKVIVGQEKVIDQLLMAVFARGHCLLEGVPGLAKTLMVSTLADSMRLDFNRIQFTPDLMPSDITGTEILQEDKISGTREFKFLPGPIFANIILADEINRTPPKTQAALLEAMQERQITLGGERHTLPDPFFVLATQNPIEQEGTYTLPEAQQDRFMFKVIVDYPSYDEEFQIAATTTAAVRSQAENVISAEEVLRIQDLVRRVAVPHHAVHYALRLVRTTRVNEPDAPDYIKDLLSWGAGPRAVQYLLLAAKAQAVMRGDSAVSSDDIKDAAHPVLRHRVVTTFQADSNGVSSDDVVAQLLEKVPERAQKDEVPPDLKKSLTAA